MGKNFFDILIDNVEKKDCPLCVGLDPHINLIPEFLISDGVKKYGESLTAISSAILNLNKMIIDEIYKDVAIVKPQIAFYEKFGVEGLYAFTQTIQYAKEKGLLVLTDAKRNDIGSTSDAYASAYLDKVECWGKEFKTFESDALTVNGYLGEDGLNPFIKKCEKNSKGIFVLAKTSNPSSSQLQDLKVGNNEIYKIVSDLVYDLSKHTIGKQGFTNSGIVVGATYPEHLEKIRQEYPHLYFLIPGLGAQGASVRDLKKGFVKGYKGAIINSSRGVIFAYKKGEYKEEEFAKAAYDKVIEIKEEFRKIK